mmetsp:Transcript_1396/g.3734  ORF Transcript_1396/g.3734 Transcript_1396/m.3734 type:complete len:362 (-) Transcript_1396:84-1169(-)
MAVAPISQLARRKGVPYRCEITGAPATLRCTECPVYFATQEHFDVWWRGIGHKIARDIVLLQSQVGSVETRQQRKDEMQEIRQDLLVLCTETAQKFLVQGKYELAVPGALQALKLCTEMHKESRALVTTYLMLAEAHLGLRRLDAAEEFLSMANWNILKHPEVGAAMMSNLQRNFGRLYATQQRYDEALQAFATDVYYSSKEFGPENIRSSPAYFQMGRVFETSSLSNAVAFYSKVVEIYVTYLESWMDHSQGKSAHPPDELGPVEIEEAVEIIKHIVEHRERRQLKDGGAEEGIRVESADGRYALGLFFIFMNDSTNAKESLSCALEGFLSTIGPDHVRSKKCSQFLDLLDEDQKWGRVS